MDFSARTACPVCEAETFSIVYEASYSDPNVVRFLQTHYRHLSTVDFGRFAGACYTIAHCGACDLLFQVNVPTGALLDHIYNQMIDPFVLQQVERTDHAR